VNNNILNDLYKLIMERKKTLDIEDDGEKSYTKYLFSQGLNKILKKIGEETAETIIAAKDVKINASLDNKNLVVGEVADLFYHVFVMLAQLDIDFSEVEQELAKRAKKMGNLKEMKAVDKNT